MSTEEPKIPLWRDERVLQIVGQAVTVVILIAIVAYFGNNLVINYQRLGLDFGFGFLERSSNFGIGDTAVPYTPTDPYLKALLVGLLNSLRVMVVGIILATVLGIVIGIARLSDNWLVRNLATVYVEVLRNTPLLLQLFFWYKSVFLKLPSVEDRVELPGPIFFFKKGLSLPWPAMNLQSGLALAVMVGSVVLAVVVWKRRMHRMEYEGDSGQQLLLVLGGIAAVAALAYFLGFDWERPVFDTQASDVVGGLSLSPEFAAILVGLTFYTAAFIAEVVRAGIQAVPKGQWEAARSLGLSAPMVMQLVVFPQALRVMIPPLTSEYLNLIKNSSLATAIGYSDVFQISQTISNQTGRSVQMLLVVMSTYLILDLLVALGMNTLNKSVQLKER